MNLVLCDDHQVLVDALAVVLRARGHRVVACTTNPAAAVEAVRSEPVDVCLLDLQFPGGSGIPAIAEILAASPATRVVVLTASTDGRLVSEALLAGASGVALKVDDGEVVIDLLDRVHAGHVVVPGAALGALTTMAETAPAPSPHELARFLTQREREVLERLVRGHSTQALARDMGVRYSTIRTHIQSILNKLGVHSKLEAVAFAVREGLVAVNPNGSSPVPGP